MSRALLVLTVLLSTLSPLTPTLTPCPEEDSPGPCYWDASERGNGIGESFITWN